VPRWISGEKQQVTWLLASVRSPPLRQAATTLCASLADSATDNRRKCETYGRL